MAMEGADKKRNRLLLVKHTHMHNTIPFTHSLMMAMKGAYKERNRLILVKQSCIHTQNKTIQLEKTTLV